MRLSELELIGFKSFGDKTRLRFDPAFTAIVGPNGSGKSNIVDAVRWLLGEHAGKQLRAPEASEILFQGERTDDRMNYAQVEMTLAALDGHDFGEYGDRLTIGRRYERDGNNHYLLNGSKSRLKDLRAVLAQYGFGLNAMSILSQGRIDAVLSLQPTERRVILEEVAQIHGFQINKEKTIEKIAATQDNLQRLDDVLREVNERMAELAQQALAARRHYELTHQKQERERALLGRDFDRRAAHAATLRKELRDALAAVESYKVQVADTREDLAEAETQVQELQGRLTEHLAGQSDLAVHATEARGVSTRMSDQERQARESWGELARREENLRARLGDLEAALAKDTFDLSETERHVATASERWLAALDEDRHTATVLEAAETALRAARQASDELQVQVRAAERDLATVEARLQQLGVADDDASTELATASDELPALQAEREATVLAQQQAEAAWNAALAAVGPAADAVQAARARVGQLQTMLQERHATAAGVEAELRTLESLARNREGWAEGVQALLDVSNTESAPAALTALWANVHVAPADAAVVEAALGPLTQLLVALSPADAEHAVAWLQQTGKGRATVAWSREGNTPAEPTEYSGVVPLASLIQTPDTHRAIVHNICRGIGVVDSRAVAVSARLAGCTDMLVTRDGGVHHAWGGVTGGGTESLSGGMVGQQARRDELSGQVTIARGAIDEVQDAAQGVEAQARDTEARLADAQRAEQETRSALALATRSVEDAERRIADRERTIRTLTERVAQIAAQTALSETSRLGLADQLAELTARLHGAGSIAQLEQEVGRLREDRARANDGLHTAQLRSQELTQRVESLQRAIATATMEQDRVAADLAPVVEQLPGVKQLLERLTADLPSVREAEAAADSALTKARATERQLREELDGLTHRLTAARSDLLGFEGDLAQAASERESIQIRLARAEADVEFLSAQIREHPWFREQFPQMGDDLIALLEDAAWKAYLQPLPPAAQLKRELTEIEAQLLELGEVNTLAARDYGHYEERHQTIKDQKLDLLNAISDLESSLREIESRSRETLAEVFEATRTNFNAVFGELFPGGEARLSWSDPADILESGIDIGVHFPGKGERHLMQFSGGERTLIAIAFLFAVLKAKPPSFVILDEVEAALDDANVERFLQLVRHYQNVFQFVVITHNKLTMEHAPELYGVTMRGGGHSQLLSVRVQEWVQEQVPEAELVPAE